jgi:hypothetical protein
MREGGGRDEARKEKAENDKDVPRPIMRFAWFLQM